MKTTPNYLAIGLLVMAAAAFIIHERLVDRRVEPPGAGCLLSEFARTAAPPVRLAIVERDGERRLVWVGPVPRFTIRSGPPCYVFDRDGRLMAWASETGEGGPLDPFKAAAHEAAPISLDEALRWAREGGPLR